MLKLLGLSLLSSVISLIGALIGATVLGFGATLGVYMALNLLL